MSFPHSSLYEGRANAWRENYLAGLKVIEEWKNTVYIASAMSTGVAGIRMKKGRALRSATAAQQQGTPGKTHKGEAGRLGNERDVESQLLHLHHFIQSHIAT